MKHQSLTQRYNRIVVERNRLLLALGVTGGLCVILGLTSFSLVGREKVVVVPPVVSREFWVATDSVSESYLEQMSSFFASLLLNVTPSSFSQRSEQLLAHVAPEAYPALKAQLVEQELEIKRRALSSSFHISHLKIDRTKLWVELSGELKLWVGNAPVEAQSKTYQLRFVQRQGRLFIQSFEEVSHV